MLLVGLAATDGCTRASVERVSFRESQICNWPSRAHELFFRRFSFFNQRLRKSRLGVASSVLPWILPRSRSPRSGTEATMSGLRFLDLIKPFTPLLPEVAAPETAKTPFNQKLMWTGLTLLIFLVMVRTCCHEDPRSALTDLSRAKCPCMASYPQTPAILSTGSE